MSVLTTLLQFWLSLKQLPLPFPQNRQQFKFKYLHNRQFYFMWHMRDGTWFGCVWFGAFFFKFLSIFGQRLCFRKVCSVGLYHWKFPEFLYPYATSQNPTDTSSKKKQGVLSLWLIPFLDSLWTLPISSRCDVLVFRMWVTCLLGTEETAGHGPPTADRRQWLRSLRVLAGSDSTQKGKKP